MTGWTLWQRNARVQIRAPRFVRECEIQAELRGQQSEESHRCARANAEVPDCSRGVLREIKSRAEVGKQTNFGLRGDHAAQIGEIPAVAKLEVERGVLWCAEELWREGAKAAWCAERKALRPACAQAKYASAAGKPW